MRPRLSHALLLAAALAAAAAPAHAQRAVVRGQVIDSRTGNPVPHAAVFVNDNQTSVVADARGQFEVTRLRAGTRAIWARAPGYTMDLSLVEVPADSLRVTLQMQSDPVRLATLQVSTSRFRRRARSHPGTMREWSERDLSGMWYGNVRQMLESRARVRAVPCSGYTGFGGTSCIYQRGTVVGSRVIVDEAPWLGGVEDLSLFNLADVARVEVYSGGRQIRVYTRHFMDWVSKRPYVPEPLGIW